MLIIDIQDAVQNGVFVPSQKELETWAQAAYLTLDIENNVSIRVVETDESNALNLEYREKDKPTNVLSFPMELPEGIDVAILGDIVVCADVVASEAQQQNKAINDHWAHMVVHGMLHLQGYDHIEDAEAEEMESLEVEILAKLGVQNPYLS